MVKGVTMDKQTKGNDFKRPDPRYVVSNSNQKITPPGLPPSVEDVEKFKAEARKAAGIKPELVKGKDEPKKD